MNIKNIIFDFGGVLLDWNPRYLYKSLFNDEVEMEYFLENICTMEWNEKQDAGRTFADGTAWLQQKHPEHKEMIQHYYDGWEVMIKGPIDENVELLPILKNNYKLLGLTNWSNESFPKVYKMYPFFENFEGIVVSGDEKLVKPGEEIFEVLLDRYQIKAHESVFIDDNPRNIATAKKIGFETVHFCNGTKVVKELQQIGVKI